jgi:Flp pilus assembly protein TadG
MLKAWRLRRLGERGSVAVEFALISSLFLLPLFLGSTDIVEIISGQAQVNTALQAMYLFAFTDTLDAGDTANALPAIQTLINSAALHSVSIALAPAGANPSNPYYSCIVGNTTTTQSTPCAAGATQQEFVGYTVSSNVNLSVPLFTNPFPVSATGWVEIQ